MSSYRSIIGASLLKLPLLLAPVAYAGEVRDENGVIVGYTESDGTVRNENAVILGNVSPGDKIAALGLLSHFFTKH